MRDSWHESLETLWLIAETNQMLAEAVAGVSEKKFTPD
jgi:hypothetical protein